MKIRGILISLYRYTANSRLFSIPSRLVYAIRQFAGGRLVVVRDFIVFPLNLRPFYFVLDIRFEEVRRLCVVLFGDVETEPYKL